MTGQAHHRRRQGGEVQEIWRVAQYSTAAQHSTAQHSTPQHTIAQHIQCKWLIDALLLWQTCSPQLRVHDSQITCHTHTRCTTARTSMRNPQCQMAGGTPPFKWWTRGQRMGARSHTPYASHHNTRARGNAGRRHTSGGERRGCAKHMDTHRAERAHWHTGEYGTAVPEGTRGTRECLRCAPLPRGEPPPHCAAWGCAEPARGLQVGGRGDNPPPPKGA